MSVQAYLKRNNLPSASRLTREQIEVCLNDLKPEFVTKGKKKPELYDMLKHLMSKEDDSIPETERRRLLRERVLGKSEKPGTEEPSRETAVKENVKTDVREETEPAAGGQRPEVHPSLQCDCGLLMAVWKTNAQGRRFARCQRAIGSKMRCSTFLWLDPEPDAKDPVQASSAASHPVPDANTPDVFDRKAKATDGMTVDEVSSKVRVVARVQRGTSSQTQMMDKDI